MKISKHRGADSSKYGNFSFVTTECGLVCHVKCSPNVPHTCGLPSQLVEHFTETLQEQKNDENGLIPNSQSTTKLGGRREGWLRVPRYGSSCLVSSSECLALWSIYPTGSADKVIGAPSEKNKDSLPTFSRHQSHHPLALTNPVSRGFSCGINCKGCKGRSHPYVRYARAYLSLKYIVFQTPTVVFRRTDMIHWWLENLE